jgi:hypothetical protein
MSKVCRCYALLIALLCSLWLCGCASSGDSDIPWNAPQSWEGSPGIPGFSPSDR